MDFGRIVQMIINQLLRRAVSGGINTALRQVSRRSGRGVSESGPAQAESPEEQAQSNAARQAGKRARQMARLTRKL